MSAFLGISLWIVLAMVIPGLMTLACLYGAVDLSGLPAAAAYLNAYRQTNELLQGAFAITAMVLTQSFGILLESLLVRNRWYGPSTQNIRIPEGIDPCGRNSFVLQPYHEYAGLYLLLAELREGEDTHGHLQRALGQFFLSNNAMISFSAGFALTVALMAANAFSWSGAAYASAMLACLTLTYLVARIRFQVIAKVLWAARRRRLGGAPIPANVADVRARVSS